MTLYLTDRTPPSEVEAAKRSAAVHAVKIYPAGAATKWLQRQPIGSTLWLSQPKKTLAVPSPPP